MRALDVSSPVREAWADELSDRLTPFMSALSDVFVLAVRGEQFAQSSERHERVPVRGGSTPEARMDITLGYSHRRDPLRKVRPPRVT